MVLKTWLLVLYLRITQGLFLARLQLSRMRVSGVKPIICMLTKVPGDCIKRAPIPHFDTAPSINISPQLSPLSVIWPSLYHHKVRRSGPCCRRSWASHLMPWASVSSYINWRPWYYPRGFLQPWGDPRSTVLGISAFYQLVPVSPPGLLIGSHWPLQRLGGPHS